MSDENPLQTQAEGIIARAKAIISKPDETWDIITKETDEPMQVFLRYAVPLAAIGPIASFIGGQVFGYGVFGFGFNWRPSFLSGVSQMLTTYVLTLLSLWLVAFIASFLSKQFEGREDFAAAFRLTAYSMTAAWLAGIFGIVPSLGFLAIVGLYSFYLFYKGAEPMMGVPQDKSVVYTVVVMIVAIVANLIIGGISGLLFGAATLGGAVG